jgi:predicted nucleic acid-binding protein
MNYLLDTNILVIYVRATELTRKIEQDLKLLTGENDLVISVVTVGEIKSIARRNKWGKKKIESLGELLERFLVADINVEAIVEKYAEIDTFSQGKLPDKKVDFTARNMGKNDLWIAATGAVLNLILVTTDGDFDHLNDEYLNVNKIDLSRYLEK